MGKRSRPEVALPLAAVLICAVAPAADRDTPGPPSTAAEVQALGPGEPVELGRLHRIQSTLLGRERTITVGLPAGYDAADSSYAVVYVLDGEANFATVQGAARFLGRYGRVPELIVVAVHNDGSRTTEMTPDAMRLHDYEGAGDRFLQFFAGELIPAIDRRYRTLPFRILHGHSHGAILGAYAFAARPELFRWHLLLDLPPRRADSFVERTLLQHLSEHPERSGRLVSIDAKFGWHREDWQQLAGAAPASLYLDRLEIDGETHETMLYRGTYSGLKSLFHDYAVKETRSKTLAELQQQYERMSRDYGYSIEIPQRLLEENILDMVFQQRGRDAEALYDHMVAVHGTEGRFRRWGDVIPSIIAAGPSVETVADLLAFRQPTLEQLQPYLGVWEGSVAAPSPFPLRVQFAVEGGRVVARTSSKLPDRPWPEGEAHVTMRLLDDGTLEWGIYNNMRPFVIKMYSVRMIDGELVGHSAIRGGKIQNLRPGIRDEDLPVPRFVLKKKSGSPQRGRRGA